MFSIKLIYRRLFKSKGILAINLVGLTLAFVTILYLVSYVIQESSYDKHIPNHERIYRMITSLTESGVVENYIICSSEQKIGLKENIPEVEEVVQLLREQSSTFKINDRLVQGKNTFASTPNFFKIFQFETVCGQLENALDNESDIVISESLAQKIFGQIDPIGKEITMDDKLSVVRAVIKDISDNTHFYFDVIRPMTTYEGSMQGLEYVTYVLFRDGVDYAQAAKKCEDLYAQKLAKGFEDMDLQTDTKMESIADIHLNTIATWDMKENGNKTLVLFLAILSLAILIIALSNYINLVIAKKDSYIKQVSIQKVSGSSASSLYVQFFIESLLVVSFSYLFSIFLFLSVKGPVSNYIGVDFFDVAWQSWQFYAIVLGIYLLSIAVACMYPAIVLGKIKIKDLIQVKPQANRHHSPLLIFQYVLVSFLLIGILTVSKQIHFIENKPKGFEADNVVTFWQGTEKINQSWTEIKNEIDALPHVVAVTGSQAYPGRGNSGQGISYRNQPMFSIDEARVHMDYLEVFGLELKYGQFFIKDGEQDQIVINEAAARKIGVENPVGEQVTFWERQVTIIGVLKDYHYSTLKDKILPIMLTDYGSYLWNISVKLDGVDNKNTISDINSILKRFDPDYVGGHGYLADELYQSYAQEHALRRIFYLGTTLGLLIAIIGLLAYAAVLSARRTKEIGVRKINGANNRDIISLLSKNFIKHIIVAFVLAAPIAWFAMHKWLENFAYRTSLDWWVFALAGLLVMGVSLITVSWQSYRTATKNPVEALRYE